MSQTSKVQAFRESREQLNESIFKRNHKGVNRFFRLDTTAYEDGPLDTRTKEIAGLSASLVLRCDDCIMYHLLRCKELGMSDDEIMDVLNVGLIVGGSIVIPHLRRAVGILDELAQE